MPWHRVVRADGRPAAGHEREALARLRAEGVPLRGERVDLGRARWEGLSDPGADMGAPRARSGPRDRTRARWWMTTTAPAAARPRRTGLPDVVLDRRPPSSAARAAARPRPVPRRGARQRPAAGARRPGHRQDHHAGRGDGRPAGGTGADPGGPSRRRSCAADAVLGLTFGRRAAAEWRDRVVARTGGGPAPAVLTFHAFAYALVRSSPAGDDPLRPLRLLSAPEQEARLRELLGHAVADGTGAVARRPRRRDGHPRAGDRGAGRRGPGALAGPGPRRPGGGRTVGGAAGLGVRRQVRWPSTSTSSTPRASPTTPS